MDTHKVVRTDNTYVDNVQIINLDNYKIYFHKTEFSLITKSHSNISFIFLSLNLEHQDIL